MTKTSRPVFLDKTINAALAFASRDETRRVLTGVHITPDYVEATDSYRLVRITHASGIDPLCFPKPLDDSEPAYSEIPEGGIIVDAASIRRALKYLPAGKHTLPILRLIAIKLTGSDAVRLSTNDLEHVTANDSRLILGTFPDVDSLLDKYTAEPAGVVSFNPTLLKQTCAAFETFGASIVTLECSGPTQPAKLTATNAAKQTMTALLMPVRAGDAS